jgi:hypothetical protein
MKRSWAHDFIKLAATALTCGVLTPEEQTSIFHEVVFFGPYRETLSRETDTAAFQRIWDRDEHFEWRYEPTPGCSCIVCAASAPGLPTLETTPDNSPGRNLTPPAVSSPEEQPRRRQGRPPGKRELMKRAGRGTLKHLAPKDRSRRSRETGKVRRALEQQQQQQTSPS